MSLPKGVSNSGIKNILGKQFKKGSSGYHFKEREVCCHICESIFISRGPWAKYCSSDCREKSRPDKYKKDFICFFCEKVFKRRAQNNGGKFCSRECSGLYLTATGEKNYFYKAFLYKPWHCNRCPVSDYELLVVHHLDYNHDNNQLDNLEILCANCHYKEHFGRGRTRKEKLEKIINFLEKKDATSLRDLKENDQ